MNADSPDHFPNGTNLGTIRMKKDGSWNVYIPTETTQKLLIDNGINETAAVKKRWKERGITKCDGDHNSVKYSLNGAVRRCDCFIFPEGIKRDSYFDELEEIEQAKFNPTPKQSAPVSNYAVNDEEEITKNFNKKGE